MKKIITLIFFSFVFYLSKEILVFNEEKHQSKLAKELIEMPVGFTKNERTQFKKTHYKVIKKEKGDA